MPTAPVTLARLQTWIDTPPYQQFLGIRAVALDPDAGTVTLRLPFRRDFQRSPDRPEIHGGVTAALIDIAGDYALAVKLGWGVPTIDLRIDYLRMAVETDLVATARAVKTGRTIGVVDVDVTDGDGRLIAVGRGTYSTKRG